jgi:integrase
LKFYLTKVKNVNYISIDINYGKLRKRISSGYSLSDPMFWDSEKQKIKKGYPDYIQINNHLNKLKSNVEGYLSDLKIHKQDISEDEFIYRVTKMINPTKIEIQKSTDVKPDLIADFNSWIIFREQTNQISQGRIKRYRSTLNHLLNFHKTLPTKVFLDELDVHYIQMLTSYLISKKNLLNSTTVSVIKVVKAFLKDMRNKYPSISEYHFKTLKFSKDPDPPAIVFNEDELKKIESAELTRDSLIRTRDFLIVHIHTLFRISDYKNVEDYNLDLNKKVIEIYQKKTGEPVRVPITSKVESILKKYDNKLPKISEQKYRENLKELCRVVGIDDLIEIVRYSGNQRIVEVKPKYELISSHTARRTGITLLIKKGVPMSMIMRISGHRSIETLMKYVRLTQEEAIDSVRKAWEEM